VADLAEYLPWYVAERLFRPYNEEPYPGILQGISKARSVVGFLLVAYFSLANGVWPVDETAVVRTGTMAAFVAAAWVCLLLLIRRPLSASVKKDCWLVLRRVLALYVTVTIGLVLLLIPVLNLLAAFWLTFFVIRAFWLICRYQFGAGDANPLLAPLVTATTAALLAAYNLGTIHSGKIPPRLDELIVLSGLGTTSLLALAEFLVLRHRGERFSTEPVEAAGWPGTLPPGGHPASGPSGGPYPGAGQPATSPYQPAAAPYGRQASRPPASPRHPRTYQFKPAGRRWTTRRYRRPLAILSAIVLGILITVYSLPHLSSPGAVTENASQIPQPPAQVASGAQEYASGSLTTNSPSITARVYFGHLDSVISALSGHVMFNTVGISLQATNPCVGTVVFSQVSNSTGAVYAQGLGSGWTAAENAPSPDAQDGNLHQQLVAPPADASAGDSWQLSAKLIAGNLQVRSAKYSLQLQGQNGSAQTWLVDGQTVTCNS
jgi:hypothetical protein